MFISHSNTLTAHIWVFLARSMQRLSYKVQELGRPGMVLITDSIANSESERHVPKI